MNDNGGLLLPERPVFATESEKVIWNSLRESLREGETLLHGLRFTDPQAGDIEIDLLLLSPHIGAAIIEVKGGLVEFRDGQWLLTNNGGGSRRIHPTDQARRAKHALRRYLDRHPDWNHGLLRTQWFLAFPRTIVDSDMGPEAPRSLIIDGNDVPSIRSIIETGLESTTREPAVPTTPWVDQAVDLLTHAPDASVSDARFARAAEATGLGAHDGIVLAGIVLSSLAIAGLGVLVAGLWGLLPSAILVTVIVTVGFSLLRGKGSNRLPVVIASAVGASVVGGFTVWGAGILFNDESTTQIVTTEATTRLQDDNIDPDTLNCHTSYAPCVLQTEWDRDCPDIGFQVTVIGPDDPYGLDRDGDGVGCQTYPQSPDGERRN